MGVDARPTRRSPSSEDGLTLVEMLVAIVIIGIIFAAAASALINLTRASVNNERRVQSTAMMTEIHEDFQARRWDDALIYTEELGELSEIGDLDLVAGEWNDLPLATITADCDLDDEDCRIESIPPTRETITVDGRDYDVFRVISWSPRVAGSDETIKRLTTVVRWEVIGRTAEARLDSERAALSADLGIDPEQVPAFDPIPSSVQLDQDGFNSQTFRFDAIFPSEITAEIGLVEAVFEPIEGEAEVSVPLAQSILNPSIFRKEFAVGDVQIDPAGVRQIQLRYVRAGVTETMQTPMTFVAWDVTTVPDDGFAGTVTSVIASPTTVVIGTRGNSSTMELCNDFTLTANVAGLRATDYVIARFNPANSADERFEMVSSTLYTLNWKTKDTSPWQPGPDGMTDTFRVSVVSGESTKESSAENVTVTFVRSSKKNGQC